MLIRLVALAVLASAASSARADPPTVTKYCVGDTGQLTLALTQAASTATAFDNVKADIRLKVGSYDISSSANGIRVESLSISGNYTDANCTVIDESQSTFVTFHDRPQFLHAGSLEITRIFGVGGFYASLQGAGINMQGGGTTRIHSNRFAGFGDLGLTLTSGSLSTGQIEFVNNVISVSSSSGLESCAVKISQFEYLESEPKVQGIVMNNTIASPDGGFDASGICVAHLEGALIANNIVVDSAKPAVTDQDLDDATSIVFRNNIFETPHDIPFPISEIGTQVMDFVFTPDVGHPFQIGSVSPAVNAGWDGAHSFLDALDIAGNPRRYAGTVVDIGAYESSASDPGSTILVTSSADSGPNTLRDAITLSNAQASAQTIQFELGDGPADCGKAIQLLSPLPEITDSVTIDGYFGIATRNAAEVGFDATMCAIVIDKPGDGVSIPNGLVVADAAPPGVALTVRGLQFQFLPGTPSRCLAALIT